jgi:hypothetical protein
MSSSSIINHVHVTLKVSLCCFEQSNIVRGYPSLLLYFGLNCGNALIFFCELTVNLLIKRSIGMEY